MLLHSFDKYTEYYSLSSKKRIHSDKSQETSGFFKIIKGNISALYVKNKVLFYQFGDITKKITNEHSIQIKKISSSEKRLNLLLDEYIEHTFIYDFEVSTYPMPFDYIDPKDSDWGLFLCSIINNKEKKENFIDSHR